MATREERIEALATRVGTEIKAVRGEAVPYDDSTPPTTGQTLEFDGTNFVPTDASGGAPYDDTDPPSFNQSLFYDGSNFVPKSFAIELVLSGFPTFAQQIVLTADGASLGGITLDGDAFSVDGSTLTLSTGVPGMISPYAGSSAPSGYVLCDGTAYSTTGTYANLFAVIGTTYGDNGAGTFRVPDFRGRALVGAGTGTGLTARSLGDEIGEESTTLSEANLPPHSHEVRPPDDSNEPDSSFENSTTNRYVGGTTTNAIWMDATANPPDTYQYPYDTEDTGSGTSFTNMQPSGVVNWIIKI